MSRLRIVLFGLLCVALAAPAQAALIGYWSFDEGAGTTVNDASGNGGGSGGTVSGATWTSGRFDDALQFGGGSYVSIDSVVGNLDTLNQQVTVAFWAYGAAAQPQQNTNFRARQGTDRVISAHVPWLSPTEVFWDAGNTGGSYDRINKPGGTSDYKGQWNHWVFTKDAAAGSMRIYLNGSLWHSGGGTRDMTGITSFVIGADDAGGGHSYQGVMDDFAVWDSVVAPNRIASLAAGLPVNVVESGQMTAADGILSPTTPQMSLTNTDGTLAPGGVGVIGTTDFLPYNPQNVATGGTADQSTTDWGGVPSRAIDGNTSGNWGDGSVTHTLNELHPTDGPWWEVDLGSVVPLSQLALYNRTDCCSGRLSDFRVSILDGVGTEVWGQDYGPNPGATLSIPLADLVMGQFVRVELYPSTTGERILSLAEVIAVSPTLADYTQQAGGILDIDVDPLTGQSDLLSTSGTVTLGGTLNVSSLSGAFARWQSFHILDAGAVIGEFDTVSLPPLGDPIQYWDTSALYTTGIITVAVPEPATLSLLALGGLGLLRRRRRR